MDPAIATVLDAARAHIDTTEGRSHSDATIAAMDPIRDAVALVEALDIKVDRNRLSASTVEQRAHGDWTVYVPRGTRVRHARRVTQTVYPEVGKAEPLTGRVVGYDPDLRLPLVKWEGGLVEACEPGEFEVIAQ